MTVIDIHREDLLRMHPFGEVRGKTRRSPTAPHTLRVRDGRKGLAGQGDEGGLVRVVLHRPEHQAIDHHSGPLLLVFSPGLGSTFISNATSRRHCFSDFLLGHAWAVFVLEFAEALPGLPAEFRER